MNKSYTFSQRVSALLVACMIPVTGLFSSAPLFLSRVNAVDIQSDTTKSSVITAGRGGETTITGRSIAKASDGKLNYTYTGNIYTANSSVYDYLSDNEINKTQRYSKAEGYADPYSQLNRAIADEHTMVTSPAEENLTIRYKGSKSNVHVYLFNKTNNTEYAAWPGSQMTYESESGTYVFTIPYNDLITSSGDLLKPDYFIINNGSDADKTGDIKANLAEGCSYLYDETNGNSLTEGKASSVYTKRYSYVTPLYFGCFYRGDTTDDYTSTNKGDGTYQGTAGNNFYRNFYWQANMSLRDGNFDASVQGLVDDDLIDGTIAKNKVKLPYFNDDWADNHATMVKYWHNITFPFYEIDVDATKVHGDATSGTAKYYQFNSREMNLYLETDDANKTGTFKETTTQIYSQPTTTDANGTVCYFPFNNTNTADSYKTNNLGFGTKFEINFKIRSDGKVDTVDQNGKTIDNNAVNATFEFMGDDDVWVFIDNKLVLDLGGDHKDTTGIIDFAEKTAYANDATKFGYNSAAGKEVSKDYIKGDISTQLTVDIRDILKDTGTFNQVGDKSNWTYNEDKTHTLTMFYMERGMYESDLLVRFNFSAIVNKNTLKIKEVTDFEKAGINTGLLELTKKAADSDVFNYAVSNAGTTADDVSESGILSPTYDYYQRQNQGLNALLTGKPVEYTTVEDTTSVYIDASWQKDGVAWYDNYNGDNNQPKSLMGVWAWKGDQGGVLLIGERVEDDNNQHLYKFETLQNYDKMIILRLNYSDFNDYYTGKQGLKWENESDPKNVWNTSGEIDLSTNGLGVTYQITGEANSYSVDKTIRSYQTVTYTEKNFDPTKGNAVKATNYIWKDDFAVLKTSQNDAIDGMTGTTDNNGAFNLMYGTADKESSAEFQGQFKRTSIMTVNQTDALRKVTRSTDTAETFLGTNGRNVSEYYNTSVTVKDKFNNVLLDENTANTTYTYNNADTVDAKEPVQLTETFTNTPKVGVLTVTKELNPSDNVKDDFQFQLTIQNIFGVQGVNVSDYSKITANHTISPDGKFTLKAGETMIITGIPYGTEYKVAELTSTDANGKTNYEQVSNTNTDFETVKEGSLTEENLAKISDNNETVVNTRLTNSLKLEKLLGESQNYTYTNDDKNKEFEFEVTLNAPQGVKLGNYKSKISGVEIGEDVETTYSFTAKVSANQSVTISGLPYGTTYTVTEKTVSDTNWTKTNEEKTSDTIGENSSVAKITNTYTPSPKGNLTVSKTVLNETGEHNLLEEDKNIEFSFKVTLTDNKGNSLTGTVIYETENEKSEKGTLTFEKGIATIRLSDGQSLTVKEIPAEYRYNVEEILTDGFELKNSEGTSGKITENATATAAFTNQKSKTIEPYVLPDAGMEDMRLTYILLLFGMVSCGIAYWYINRQKVRKS